MTLLLWMRILHFLGFTLWIAGMVAMAASLLAGARSKLGGVLGDAGATFAILTGLYTAMKASWLGQPWLHIKLALVAVLIGVHITLRVRTRKGTRQGAEGLLAAAIAIVACIFYIIVMKPFGR